MEKQELIREGHRRTKEILFAVFALPGGRGAAGKIRESIHGMQH